MSGATDVAVIGREFAMQTEAINVEIIAAQARERIDSAVRREDLPELLACYDNKGLLALAAEHLRAQGAGNFRQWLVRVLSNGTVPNLDAALREVLPQVRAA